MISATINLMPDIFPFADLDPAAILSDVQEKAKFFFRTSGGHRTHLSIPTFEETFFENAGAGKLVDRTDADVAILASILTEDTSNGGINATDSHGNDIVEFLYGEQFFGRG
jgi:hypothetical protein